MSEEIIENNINPASQTPENQATPMVEESSKNVNSEEEGDGSELAEGIWTGSTLNWSSPKIDIQLYVELPFWLMMPEGAFQVKHQDVDLKVEVLHACEEGQIASFYLKTHASTIYIRRPNEPIPESIKDKVKTAGEWSGSIHRTTLVLKQAWPRRFAA